MSLPRLFDLPVLTIVAPLLVGGLLLFAPDENAGPLLLLPTTLTLTLPEFTTTTIGPTYSTSQLIFASSMSLILYLVFVFVQTVRHTEHFLLKVMENEALLNHPTENDTKPQLNTSWARFALLVLMPETLAALHAARRNQIQTGLNLTLDSARATIRQTIPTVGVVASSSAPSQ